ncbi:MAG: glycosyltransferase [Solirubrobacterales bacterium]
MHQPPRAAHRGRCDGYDLVAIASAPFAEEMRERTTTPIIVLEQATDPRVFYPDSDPKLGHDLVYVANSRNVLRPIVRDLLPPCRPRPRHLRRQLGGLIDTSLVVADHVPNDELRQVYSSAAIVLNDHWDDMRERGFISSRIYDALACRAVVSDEVAGLDQFGDAVVTYRDGSELRAVLDQLLADPEGLRARSQAAAAIVRDAHTFADRIDVLEREIQRTATEIRWICGAVERSKEGVTNP